MAERELMTATARLGPASTNPRRVGRLAYAPRVHDWSTTKLFSASLGGDQRAWEVLVERLSPAVWGVVRRCGLNEVDSAELFQIVWLRLWDRRDTIRDPERLPGWVKTTARNEAFTMLKASARQEPTDLEHLQDQIRDDLYTSPEQVAEHAAVLELLMAGFKHLTTRCKQLLRLSLARPRVPQSEIAEIMQMAQGSVGPTRARCLDQLRAIPEVAQLLERSDE